MNKEQELQNMRKILKFIDKPLLWFLLVLFIGLAVIDESYNELPASLIVVFSFVVWEYERYKRGK